MREEVNHLVSSMWEVITHSCPSFPYRYPPHHAIQEELLIYVAIAKGHILSVQIHLDTRPHSIVALLVRAGVEEEKLF